MTLILIVVSAMAMEEFSSLQQKFEVEAECRHRAESYAAEVSEIWAWVFI